MLKPSTDLGLLIFLPSAKSKRKIRGAILRGLFASQNDMELSQIFFIFFCPFSTHRSCVERVMKTWRSLLHGHFFSRCCAPPLSENIPFKTVREKTARIFFAILFSISTSSRANISQGVLYHARRLFSKILTAFRSGVKIKAVFGRTKTHVQDSKKHAKFLMIFEPFSDPQN